MSKGFAVAVFLAAAFAASPDARAAACTDGLSAGIACSHVEFIGHLDPGELGGAGERLNDIWGWVDPWNGDEYVIVGMQDGTAFARLQADGTPLFLGRLAASDGMSPILKQSFHDKSCHDEVCGGEDSAWRDVKVFDHYAYIVSEAVGHGMQVFDLHELRALDGTAPGNDLPLAAHYAGIGHAHNVFINEASARAYVVGHDRANVAGGLHVLDLSEPLNPQMLAELNGDGYTHDVQCVDYAGPDADIAAGSELCFASNEDTLTVWNVTDPSNAKVLSRTGYSQAAYTHQGWLSEDHRYFFLNDELDEQHTGTRTHLRVFDVSDVDAPALATDYFAPTLAIDHNNYVHGRWLYQSNYAAGLRILDVLDPLQPVEAAWFDPQPTDNADFYGTWSNFVFPSGHVAFTDIHNGLYVVKPEIASTGPAPDLGVSVELDRTMADAGESVNGTIRVRTDSIAAASDVMLVAHLPAVTALRFAEVAEPAGWDCGASTERVMECRIDSLPASSESVFAMVIDSAGGGVIDLYAMAYADHVDAAPGDNIHRATFTARQESEPTRGGGSAGGGAMTWLVCCLLLAMRLREWRIRR